MPFLCWQADPGHVTLEWVLGQMEKRLEKDDATNNDVTYLIDFIPNLKYMLKLEDVFSSTEALEKFEEKVEL